MVRKGERNSWGREGRREGGTGKCARKEEEGRRKRKRGEEEEGKLEEKEGEEEHKNHQSVSPVLQRHY